MIIEINFFFCKFLQVSWCK